MGQLIDGISVVNQDMLKRNADLERRNEDLSRQLAKLAKSRTGLRSRKSGGGGASKPRPGCRGGETAADTCSTSPSILSKNEDVCDASRQIRDGSVLAFSWNMAAFEGRQPHPLFDIPFYVAHHPEVAEIGTEPGAPFPADWRSCGSSNPHPLFDTVYYLDEYTDVADAGLNPLIHFIENGAAGGPQSASLFRYGRVPGRQSGCRRLRQQPVDPLRLRRRVGEGRPIRIRVPPGKTARHTQFVSPGSSPMPRNCNCSGQCRVNFCIQPVISVVVPVYRVPLPVLKAMVESMKSQTYSRWELCLAHGAPEDLPARAWLRTVAQDDRRIKIDFLSENLGISGNSNRALALATGEYVGLLDHDDTLAPFALYEVVKVINEKPEVDFLYSDKDCLNERGERISPLFKPQWSPELMLSANYLTHFCVMRTGASAGSRRLASGYRRSAGLGPLLPRDQRVIERSGRIEFIDKVLYHWGIVATSVASGGLKAKPYALRSQVQTISERLSRVGGKGKPTHPAEWRHADPLGAAARRRSASFWFPTIPRERMLEHARETAAKHRYPSGGDRGGGAGRGGRPRVATSSTVPTPRGRDSCATAQHRRGGEQRLGASSSRRLRPCRRCRLAARADGASADGQRGHGRLRS